MTVHVSEEYGTVVDYVFAYCIPLNASELTCLNIDINNPLFILNGVDLNL